MGIRAKAINTLYKANRIDIFGVRRAVEGKLITAAEFAIITGMEYVA